MFKARHLLGLAAAAALTGCGQSGPLYLPDSPAAAQRATLPQTLNPASAAPAATPQTAPRAEPATEQ